MFHWRNFVSTQENYRRGIIKNGLKLVAKAAINVLLSLKCQTEDIFWLQCFNNLEDFHQNVSSCEVFMLKNQQISADILLSDV